MPTRITTYKQAFEEVLGITYGDKAKAFVQKMEALGHNEHGICFAVWKSQDKLLKYRTDPRLLSIMENEIKKWSWPKGDPRWDEHHKRKLEEVKVAELRKDVDRKTAVAEIIKDYVKNRQSTKYTPKHNKGYVYFVQGHLGGAIKIGYSLDPEARLKSLQTGYPDLLTILLLIPGTEKAEKALHAKFEASRLQGEWFKPDKELLDMIAELKAEQQ